jgi:hypothetical protein
MTGLRATRVWIFADSATVLRWSPELTLRHRIDSMVPGRHGSTSSDGVTRRTTAAGNSKSGAR